MKKHSFYPFQKYIFIFKGLLTLKTNVANIDIPKFKWLDTINPAQIPLNYLHVHFLFSLMWWGSLAEVASCSEQSVF